MNSTIGRIDNERIAPLIGRYYQETAPCQDFGVIVVVAREPESPRAVEVAPALTRVPLIGGGGNALVEVKLHIRSELRVGQEFLSVLVSNTTETRRWIVEIGSGDPLHLLQ
jgi:hypothetical protein